MSKLFNLVCLLFAAIGVVVLLQGNWHFTSLRVEYDRLERDFGSLNPTDPTKTLVECIDTQAPDFFRWRVYIPPVSDCQLITKTIGSRSQTTLNLDPQGTEVAFSLRYREFDGEAKLYLVDSSGSSVITFVKPLQSFIAQHWNELDHRALASEGLVEVEPGRVLTLFEILVPDHLLEKLPKSTRQTLVHGSDVLKIEFGPLSSLAESER